MKEKVFFIESPDGSEDALRCEKLKGLIQSKDLFGFIGKNELVAVKTHLGEGKKSGYVRPLFIKMMGDLIRAKEAEPFLTETSTLYKGNRSNGVRHSLHAHAQGFGIDSIGFPFIPSDGLFGDEELEVEIPGKIYKSVKLAAIIKKAALPGHGVALHGAHGVGIRRGPEEHGHGVLQQEGEDDPALHHEAEDQGQGLHQVRGLRGVVPRIGHHHGGGQRGHQ